MASGQSSFFHLYKKKKKKSKLKNNSESNCPEMWIIPNVPCPLGDCQSHFTVLPWCLLTQSKLKTVCTGTGHFVNWDDINSRIVSLRLTVSWVTVVIIKSSEGFTLESVTQAEQKTNESMFLQIKILYFESSSKLWSFSYGGWK